MKLLLDMNLSPLWQELLRSEGHDAVHWSAVGRANAPDSEIFAYAKEHLFVIITRDLDFSAILAVTGDATPSVIQLRVTDLSPEAIGTQLLGVLTQLSAVLDEGALVTITSSKERVRVLPLRS
jgi:predicted nuclease of predicted toxin-antitoxin system